ncbi:cation:proton antiporter [Bermanella sp. R86510]|uniref:cation:proton antiporter n=1 Tax=unclassified Bermanella TaxID=2627862 RepID=UPI0037CB28F7
MVSNESFLLTIGGILLIGLVTSTIAKRTVLPRITLLLFFGILIGPEGLNLIPELFTEHFPLVADMTLLMVGFLIGSKLTKDSLQETVTQALAISIIAALFTTALVSWGLWIFGVDFELAMILGCIAAATAPAAILDLVMENGPESRFGHLLVTIVALDDVWALLLFAIGLAIVSSLQGNGLEWSSLIHAGQEIGGAILVGVLIGLPAAYLTGRINPGEPGLTEALGIVFVCGGVALFFGFSHLIATMVMGAVIANLAKHHAYPFYAIENIEWPFMVTFFVLAGVSLELDTLQNIGTIGLLYVLFRGLGKYIGALLGSKLSHATSSTQTWMGLALMPQAGVAIGMALVASNTLPQQSQLLLPLVISTTIIFELIGPILTQIAIKKGRRP